MPPPEVNSGRFGNRNGLFLKVLVGVNVAVMGAGVIGGVGMYREQGVMKSQLEAKSELERRIEKLEALADSINADRNKRTEIIEQFREKFRELDRRLDAPAGTHR